VKKVDRETGKRKKNNETLKQMIDDKEEFKINFE
jgi:hypothetical protein